MARKPQLLDQWGQPVRRAELKREIATASIGSVRSPISGTPGNNLDPVRLANILRAADQGDPVQYMELAEIAEERNPHYLGVLGTRKRSVSQIKIRVEAASDDKAHVEHAERVEDWVARQELQGELFDILDSIGKGYSFTEIIWDTSLGQWNPERLEWRDPRWFGFNQVDLNTPMMLGDNGQLEPLPAFKFVYACMKAKSGLTIRSGLARVALWNWLFKSYTEKDWAIFSQTYGQPLRVGKWGPNASEDDKGTLFQAVANIAGDCAAIIPQSMEIEFIETGNLSATGQLYKDRVDYLDRQISKAVLGQTATTDADTGGLGSGKEHRQVQEDIERADAMALSAILNRQLVRPGIDLEFGSQERYPTLIIEDEEPEDLELLTSSTERAVRMGVQIREDEFRTRLGFEKPEDGDRILTLQSENLPQSDPLGNPQTQNSIFKRFSGAVKRQELSFEPEAHSEGQRPSQGVSAPLSPVAALTDRLLEEVSGDIEAMIRELEAMADAASDVDELRDMILAAFPSLDALGIQRVFETALLAAEGAGIAQFADER